MYVPPSAIPLSSPHQYANKPHHQAPIAPSKPKPSSSTTSSGPTGAKRLTARQKARARLADPLLPRKLHREDNVVADGFINSKRDKRLIKRSAFVSRISKPASSSTSTSTSSKKRRRPNKKLVATLESLGDALADIQDAMDAEEAEKRKNGQGVVGAQQEGKIAHKSLRTRPGALKRKEKVVRGEMERFGRSLAQLSGIPASGPPSGAHATTAAAAETKEMDTEMGAAGQEGSGTQPTSATSNRWAALRGFISATMEQNPAFLGKT